MAAEFDLCRAFIESHPDDAGRALERLPIEQLDALIETMPPATIARAMTAMASSVAADCTARLDPQAAAAVLSELRVGRASLLLRQMDTPVRAAIIERLPHDERRMVAAMLRYPEGTAGALMDPRVVACPNDLTARDALALLRGLPRHLHEYVYVVDRDQQLVGVVSIGALTRARPADPVAGIMVSPVSRLSAQANRAAILAHPAWRQFHALPVVDDASRLVGAISYQTFRAVEEEARGRKQQPDAMTTVFALGELYWLSLSGMLDGAASVVRRVASGADQEPEGSHGSF